MPLNNRKSSGPAVHLYCIPDLMVAASFVGMGLDLNGLLFFVVLLRWDRRTATVVPDEEVFYLVAFLRNVLSSGPGLQSMLDENARILRVCEDLNGKHYLPRYTREEQWKRHFRSEKWTAFVQHKHMFDPHAILAPGQNIFPRNQNPLDQLLPANVYRMFTG
jgi:cytokinin dehydrogenase